MFRTICTAFGAVTLISCTGTNDCGNWKTYQFFVAASAQEVVGCLNAGADVNAKDIWGQSPLYQATLVSKNHAVIEVLIAAGAN